MPNFINKLLKMLFKKNSKLTHKCNACGYYYSGFSCSNCKE